MDPDGFWIILVHPARPKTWPNPVGVCMVVPTLVQAKNAVRDEVNGYCQCCRDVQPEWKRIGLFAGEETTSLHGDRYIVWPDIMSSMPEWENA